MILTNAVVANCEWLWRPVTEHRTSPWHNRTNTPCGYRFLGVFLIQVWLKMILFAWNGVNSSRLVSHYFWGSRYLYLAMLRQIKRPKQNSVSFLLREYFKTIIIWNGSHVQVWNFAKGQSALVNAETPLPCAAATSTTWQPTHCSPDWSYVPYDSSWSTSYRGLIALNSFLPQKSAEGTFISKQCTNGFLTSLRSGLFGAFVTPTYLHF